MKSFPALPLCFLTLLAASAAWLRADETNPPLRTGKAAFGDWTQD